MWETMLVGWLSYLYLFLFCFFYFHIFIDSYIVYV